MASSRIIGTVCGDHADHLPQGDLRQQVRQQRAIVLATRGELNRAHSGARIHGNMDFPPLPPE